MVTDLTVCIALSAFFDLYRSLRSQELVQPCQELSAGYMCVSINTSLVGTGAESAAELTFTSVDGHDARYPVPQRPFFCAEDYAGRSCRWYCSEECRGQRRLCDATLNAILIPSEYNWLQIFEWSVV